MGSTFTTPVFSVTPTYTIVTTFPSATAVQTVTISGTAGGTPATGPYTYTYTGPVSSLPMTALSSLDSSLAAAGEPTQFTSGYNPNPDGLQIVDGALSSYQSCAAVLFTLAVGAIAGVLYL
jgi:hypothetical protein